MLGGEAQSVIQIGIIEDDVCMDMLAVRFGLRFSPISRSPQDLPTPVWVKVKAQ